MERFRQFFFLFVLFLFTVFPVFSQTSPPATQRVSTCDLCGFCPPNPPPSNWSRCCQCVYPEAGCDNSYSMATLNIDPLTNTPPTPYPGRHYTLFGCISTNVGSFTKSGAAAGVSQILLNVIFGVAGGIAFLYLLYGSFVVLTSQQEAEKLNYGKSIIYNAVVGLIFCFFSVFIINFIASNVLRIPGF